MNTFTLERNNYRRKLIALVKQHPILWNKTQENYNRNRPQKIQAWHAISEQLDISVDKLRRTWENLRDQYRRDLKREVRYGFKSKWRFFSDMDFIRNMVSCKEHGFKEAEFSDSDSELDITDNQQATQNKSNSGTVMGTSTVVNTTSTLTQSINTSCSSTSTTRGSTITPLPNDFLSFQPIVLTKQWQPLPETQFAPHNPHIPVAYTVDMQASCDSSKDPIDTLSSQVAYETLTKQEPDLDLELEQAAQLVVELQEPSTNSKLVDNQNSREFQEPCVSTSSTKRSRASIEENSDTQNPAPSRSHVKSDPDLNTKDDDYYFVMSLLPSLRQIPRNRKFPLRIGIMSLIAKDLEEICKE